MKIQKNITLSPLSTFLIGGETDEYTQIHTKDDIKKVFQYIKKNSLPYMYIGGGSNILFSDKGYRGIILHFKNNSIVQQNDILEIEAGTRIMEIFSFAAKQHMDFSVFSTIPGTLGGAIAGNAGLPDGEMKDIVKTVTLFDTHKEVFVKKDADFFNFEYRHTHFQNPNFYSRYIIWSAQIHLPPLDEKEIRTKAKQYLSTRKKTQPWGKTGGSFFKNDEKGAAGYFLDQVGMKNQKIGGAFFSEKHANFMMNDGSATQSDIINLGKEAKQKVLDRFGVSLTHEIRILDEYGKRVEL